MIRAPRIGNPALHAGAQCLFGASAAVVLVAALGAGGAAAQSHLAGRGECDQKGAFLVNRPDCLGYNPYYVPPGSSTAVGFRAGSPGQGSPAARSRRAAQ